MAGVGFADCASVRLIVGTGRSLPEGSRPVISRPRPVVRRVLQVTGLDTLCDLT
jgi:anti-anti-sigma regulatory factor